MNSAGSTSLTERNSIPTWIPRLFREPKKPLLVLACAWPLTLFGSIAIAFILSTVAPATESPDFSFFMGKGFLTIFLLAVLTPFVETLILATITSILLFFCRPMIAILISSLGWAFAHSLQAPAWGLVVWWPFVIFTLLFVVWKERSLGWAIAMPFAAHFFQNVYTSVLLGFPGLLPTI